MITVSLALFRTTASTAVSVSRTIVAIAGLASRRIKGHFHSRGAVPVVIMSFALFRA